MPGEFHEDRWQRTAEDSERCMIPRTREAGGAHRIQVIAWRRGLQDGLWHGDHAHRYSRGIPAWQRGTSDRPLARRPCPQVLQGHPRVAKGLLTSLWQGDLDHRYLRGIPAWQRTNTDRSSARRVGPQMLQRHPGVAKGDF